MRRRIARPFGQSISRLRMVSMLMGVLVLWMMYARLKDPATWRDFVNDSGPSAKQSGIARASDSVVQTPRADEAHDRDSPSKNPDWMPEAETVVAGPNDLDQDEVAAAQEDFERVIDRAPIKPREWDAYWRLMGWSRTQSFSELEQRAKDDVPFTQFWEQPNKFRGQLVQLRLHVRRVLKYEASENPLGITDLYEAWGWTDESRSLTFPYTIVFAEPPQGLPIGSDIRTEMVFVGYFMKIMSYTTIDRDRGTSLVRGAPMLIGRARLVPSSAAPPAESDPWLIALIVAGGVLVVGFSIWNGLKTRGQSKRRMLPDDLSAIGSSIGGDTENPFELIGATQPTSVGSISSETSDPQPVVPPSPAEGGRKID